MRFSSIGGLTGDVRYAGRQIRRQPGFALIVVLTLGGAMGVSTAFFSLINSSLFKPWPVKDPDRIVVTRRWVPLDQTEHWTEYAKLLEGVAWRRMGNTGQKLEGHRVFFDFVSANYLQVLGIPLSQGRSLSRESGSHSFEPEALISYRTWQLFFDSDPAMVGRSIALDGARVRVVGITAPGFEGADGAMRKHLWFSRSAIPMIQPKLVEEGDQFSVQVIGRRSPGVTTEQAEGELKMLSAAFPSNPENPVQPFELTGTDGYSRGRPGPQALATASTLLLAVAFLSLIACANVSNLLLARGHARRGEIAIRLSLGASRSTIVRQLLVEGLILALAAGAIGVAVSMVLPGHIFASVPELQEMIAFDFRPDLRVFGWALGLSTLACVVFGLSPALQSTRLDVSQILKDSDGVSSPSLKASLTSMQAVVSVTALAVAGLVLRSEPNVQARRFTRAMQSVAVVRPEFPQAHDASRRGVTMRGLTNQLESTFGASNVAGVSQEPHAGPPDTQIELSVSPRYFDVLDLPLTAGRTFSAADPSNRVALINEGLARNLWPGESAIGKFLPGRGSDSTPREIIGVVRDRTTGDLIVYSQLAAESAAVLFVRAPEAQVRRETLSFTANVDPETALGIVRGTTWAARALPASALTARMFGEFGAFVLALATTGLFTLSQYAVRQRRREIGIRRALGANAAQVLRAILAPSLRSMSRGLVAGVVTGLFMGLAMRHWDLPSGIDPWDVTTYGSVVTIMAIAALIATWHPSRAAMRVEPATALRYE